MTTSEYATLRPVTAPTWIVPLGHGTSVYGAACVYHRLWGFSNRVFTLQNIYGLPRPTIKSFEAKAKQLSSTIFGGLSPREVLERHTLFGFYSRAHTEGNASRWATESIAGPKAAGLVKKYMGGVSLKVVKSECWFCADCVNEDVSEFGYSSWRYLHQVPGLDYCHKHLRLLIGRCHKCDEPYDLGTRFSMPGEPCTKCGTPVRKVGERALSRGAIDLSIDCGRLAAGELPRVRPLEWARFVERYGGRKRGAKDLVLRELEDSWNGRIPTCLRRSVIRKELDLLNGPGQVVVRLVVYGALNRMGQLREEPIVQHHQIKGAVEAVLADRLLPVGLAGGLLRHAPVSKLAKDACVSPSRIRAAIASLPSEVQSEVTPAERSLNVPAALAIGRNLGFDELREKYRNKILWVLANWEKPTRTMLWRKLPKEIMWLRANDAEWLDHAQPDKIRLDIHMNRIEPS